MRTSAAPLCRAAFFFLGVIPTAFLWECWMRLGSFATWMASSARSSWFPGGKGEEEGGTSGVGALERRLPARSCFVWDRRLPSQFASPSSLSFSDGDLASCPSSAFARLALGRGTVPRSTGEERGEGALGSWEDERGGEEAGNGEGECTSWRTRAGVVGKMGAGMGISTEDRSELPLVLAPPDERLEVEDRPKLEGRPSRCTALFLCFLDGAVHPEGGEAEEGRGSSTSVTLSFFRRLVFEIVMVVVVGLERPSTHGGSRERVGVDFSSALGAVSSFSSSSPT